MEGEHSKMLLGEVGQPNIYASLLVVIATIINNKIKEQTYSVY